MTSIGEWAFAGNELEEVILSAALYGDGKPSSDAFEGNPAGLKFYEYDENAPGNKGRYLGSN